MREKQFFLAFFDLSAVSADALNRMTIRAAYGIFFDAAHLHQMGGRRDTAPNGASVGVNSAAFEDPWASYPGGVSPFPMSTDKNAAFALNSVYVVAPWDLKTPYINQWNLSVQRQVGSNWLLAGNYIGSNIIHSLFQYAANPAVYDARPSCAIAGRTFTPCTDSLFHSFRSCCFLQSFGGRPQPRFQGPFVTQVGR